MLDNQRPIIIWRLNPRKINFSKVSLDTKATEVLTVTHVVYLTALRLSYFLAECIAIQLLTCYVYVERFTEIERENRILLEKMTNILQNPKGISHANAHLEK